MSRDEYTAPARQRRSAATELRRAGLSLRAIAAALRCSLAEIQRVLTAGVQGSPGLSDFKGVPAPSSAIPDAPTTPKLSGSRAVVSAVGDDDEHVPTARSAERSTSIDYDRARGFREETNAGESPVAYIQRRISEIVAKLREPERPP